MTPPSQKKIAKKVDADDNSSDSLSFASFLPVQDSQSIPPPAIGNGHIKKLDEEFEFCHSTPVSDVYNESRNHPVCPTQIQLEVFLNQANAKVHKHEPKSSVHIHCNKKLSDNATAGTKVSKKPYRDRHIGKREGAASKSWFGRRIYHSMISPCRECKVREPTIRTQNMPAVTSKPR